MTATDTTPLDRQQDVAAPDRQLADKAVRPTARCQTCHRRTGSPTGRCTTCRGLKKEVPAPGQPTVEEVAAYYQAKMRFLRDRGYRPGKVRGGDADAVLSRERFPSLSEFVAGLRRGVSPGATAVTPGG